MKINCVRIAGLIVVASWGTAFAAGQTEKSGSLDFELAVTSDNNVNRGGYAYTYRDSILSATISKSNRKSTGSKSQLVYRLFGLFDNYSKYDKLTRAAIGMNGAWQFRQSGAFAAPTYSLLAKAYAENVQSSLRSGTVVEIGASVLKPVTDRISVTGFVTAKQRNASSSVFDTMNTSARVNFDYLVSRRSTVYLTYNHITGDMTLSAPWAAPYDSYPYDDDQVDDAFATGWHAYRFDATTDVATLGYNFMVNEKSSIDVSMMSVRSKVYAGPSYKSTIIGLAYLKRF